MADFSNVQYVLNALQGTNVEDRRNTPPIDTVTWPRPDGVLQLPNKFESGNGTMVDFDASKDFAPEPYPNPIGRQAGIKQLQELLLQGQK